MYRKSLAGWLSVICSVDASGADSPEMLLEFWKAAMFAAVAGCVLVFVKYACSLLQ